MYESTAITFDNMAFGQPVERDQPDDQRLPRLQQLDLLRAGVAHRRALQRRHRRGDRDGRRRRRAARTTRSSTTCCARARPRGSGGTGSAAAAANRSSRSRHCGPSAASTPTTGPRPKDGWTSHHRGRSVHAHALLLARELHRPASMAEHVRSANVATAMQVLNAVPRCAMPRPASPRRRHCR